MNDRAQDQRRVHGAQRKARLLLLDEVPGRPLRKRLAGPIARAGIPQRLLLRDRVPVLLAVRVANIIPLLGVQDGREGARDDDLLHAGRVLLDRLQHARRSNDRRVEQVLLGVCDVEVEGGGGMDHRLQAVDFHRLVEGALLRDVGHDAEIELRGGGLRVRIADFLGFFFGSHGGYYGVSMLQQDIEDMRSNEAAATCCCVVRTLPMSLFDAVVG